MVRLSCSSPLLLCSCRNLTCNRRKLLPARKHSMQKRLLLYKLLKEKYFRNYLPPPPNPAARTCDPTVAKVKHLTPQASLQVTGMLQTEGCVAGSTGITAMTLAEEAAKPRTKQGLDWGPPMLNTDNQTRKVISHENRSTGIDGILWALPSQAYKLGNFYTELKEVNSENQFSPKKVLLVILENTIPGNWY